MSSILSKFAILGGSPITGLITISNKNDGNGIYYGNTSAPDTAIVTTAPGSETVTNLTARGPTDLITLGNAEIVNFRSSIIALPVNNTLANSYISTNLTILPGKSGGNSLTLTGTTINFDAQNNLNAKFYINPNSFINISSCSFNLVNGAQSNNIFWIGSSVTIGIQNAGTNFYGNIYTTGLITVGGTTSSNSVPIYGSLYSINNSINFPLTGGVLHTEPFTIVQPTPSVSSEKPSKFWYFLPFFSLIIFALLTTINFVYKYKTR
jgi:hypothetical protein